MSQMAATAAKKPEVTHTPDYPKKRLVVCCDGTWQASNHGNRAIPSNVAKINRSIKPFGFVEPYDKDQPDKVRQTVPQIVYYDAGVGTGMGWLDKKYSGISDVTRWPGRNSRCASRGLW